MTGPESGVGITGEIVVILPCLDDWDAIRLLLPRLDSALAHQARPARVLVVDDGSTIPSPADLVSAPLSAIRAVDVLVLRRNVGHQRALCIALCHVAKAPDFQQAAAVLVMDGDGEDAPEDVPRLLARLDADGYRRAVFAQRLRRSEGMSFRLFYWLYRQLHRMLTGLPVQVGNFSALPLPLVRRLTVVPELWNHYAAATVHARLPVSLVLVNRAHRLSGTSRMQFVALVGHGMSAMSVFADRIGVRALVVSAAVGLFVTLGMVATLAIRLFTARAIPGWATSTLGLLAVLLLQTFLLSLIFTFLIHLGRSGSGFLPVRDTPWFVDHVDRRWSRDVEL